jgi:gamma-glutamyl hydrolase
MSSNKKIVGIITVPLSPGRRYYKVCGDSYISTAHINWLKRAGLGILAIPYDTKKHEDYFKLINGLYLPSGGVFASNSQDYYDCCKKFIQLSIKANDDGDHFPVWGGCMGMQQMMIMSDGNDDLDNFLQKFDSFKDYNIPLIITNKGYKSTLLKNAPPKFINKLLLNDSTLNNHMMGVSPSKFKRSKLLNSMYFIVSNNYDRQGKMFVSTIEGRFYPFFGVQWHPERSSEMDYFATVFATEVNKNLHNKRIPKNKKMQYKNIDCMNYSDQLYNRCNFYWHNNTSEHSRKLCGVLNKGKKTDCRI